MVYVDIEVDISDYIDRFSTSDLKDELESRGEATEFDLNQIITYLRGFTVESSEDLSLIRELEGVVKELSA